MRHISIDQEGPVSIITLNRPERRNALSLDMMIEFSGALDEVHRSESRVVVVAGQGKVFCSGHDLTELTRREEREYQRIFEVCSDMMLRLQRMPQPVIAEVQGIATAAGCQLVAACDLAVASETAQFATPGVKIGLFCTTPMVPLVRAIGRKRAMEMLFTGDPIDASKALEWGLVNRVVPQEQLRETTLALAEKIAQASPLTVATGKRAFYSQIGAIDPDAYACATGVMVRNSMAEDAQEGISAFLGKRSPVWSGR